MNHICDKFPDLKVRLDTLIGQAKQDLNSFGNDSEAIYGDTNQARPSYFPFLFSNFIAVSHSKAHSLVGIDVPLRTIHDAPMKSRHTHPMSTSSACMPASIKFSLELQPRIVVLVYLTHTSSFLQVSACCTATQTTPCPEPPSCRVYCFSGCSLTFLFSSSSFLCPSRTHKHIT
ncbi:hypothetical protein V8E52_005239 [Russula decolorans]